MNTEMWVRVNSLTHCEQRITTIENLKCYSCKYVSLIFVFFFVYFFFFTTWLRDICAPLWNSFFHFPIVPILCWCCSLVRCCDVLSYRAYRKQHIKFLHLSKKVLLTPPDEGPRVKGQRIKLQDIVDGLYVPQRANGSWIDGKFHSQRWAKSISF